MIVLQGVLLVPPEKGTIIGRAIWKPRYVVFGTGAPMKSQTEIMAESKNAARKGLKASSSKSSSVDVSQTEPESDGLYISIYKAKGDWEYLAQHKVSAFKSCEVRALAHRKGAHTLPTLLLELNPDPLSDKARKRRSSRTSGLTTKDPWANIYLFRSLPEERYTIYDWQAQIKPHLTPDTFFDNPITPGSQFHNFSNPFISRENSRRGDLHSRASDRDRTISSYPHAPRERPSAIISPSPSLRSRRSDLSSQASSQHPAMGFPSPHPPSYTTLPTDLPSPASTSYEPQFVEGWTAAQGRSSALSSHTRGSNSIASAVAPPGTIASTPPGPRETILDRAFQLRCIPGSERISENDEDQLSSLARFEALMREVDEQKIQKEESQTGGSKDFPDWNPDAMSEDESDSGEPELNHDDSDEVDGLELSDDDDVGIPAQAQVAIEYISGRRTPIPGKRPLSPAPSSPPVPFLNAQAMSAFHGHRMRNDSPSGLRPRTGTNPSPATNFSSPFLPVRSSSSVTVPTHSTYRDQNVVSGTTSNLKTPVTDGKENRRSRDSVKRLSFQEFTRRLSSTSSLLLVQTNVSSNGSRRTSFEVASEAEERGSGQNGKNCGWRGSVGAFGSEPAFI